MAASVERDERIRLFCALRLPDDVADRLSLWQVAELAGGRLVPRDDLHLTLAFLGHRPRRELPAILAELRTAAAAAGPMRFTVRRYRETRHAAMLVLDDEGGAGALMADDLQTRLERLGVYRREGRPWLPHVTVMRYRRAPGLRPSLPNVCTIVPSDAAAYLSRLGPAGAQYEILESVALGG
jgi:2'-5' RNA ligase